MTKGFTNAAVWTLPFAIIQRKEVNSSIHIIGSAGKVRERSPP
ncbi:MAG: hypothetical protein WC716_00630 [Chitinophagaceae bacterium]